VGVGLGSMGVGLGFAGRGVRAGGEMFREGGEGLGVCCHKQGSGRRDTSTGDQACL